MLIVLDQNYRPIATSDMTITQGDAALGRLLVVAPPAVGIAASFQLPDETITQKYPLFMNPAKVPDEVDYYVYSLNVKSNIFSGVSGKLLIQLTASITGSDGTNQEFAVDPIEMNVLRGAVTIPQVGKDIPSDETWTSLLNGLSAITRQVTILNSNAVTWLDNEHNLLGLNTGYYKVKKGAKIYLDNTKTKNLTDSSEDMLLFVEHNSTYQAAFVAIKAPRKQSQGYFYKNNPKFIYGYSNAAASEMNEFELKTYAEPYKEGYGISIVDQTISVNLPVAETQSV